MKRKIMDKYDAAEESKGCVDGLAEAVNLRQFDVHYPEMTDSVINKWGKRVSKRKIRSVGTVKEMGKRMRKSWY